MALNDVLLGIYQRPDFWSFIAIPFVAAFVGWLTNWVAIEMTFRPLEFTGIRLGSLRLGWQGIIPAKAGKMAGIVVDNSLSRLAPLSEMFRQMEPEKIAEHITRTINADMEDYVDEIMSERNEVLWENVPIMVKKRVYARARRQIPDIMDNIVDDMAANIEELVDLREMVVGMMQRNTRLLVYIFKQVGHAELSFVVRSGAYLGFLFGLVQMAVYYLHPENWVMPVFGFLVGYVTNWLALNIIFRPVEPIWIGPYCIHGLFMRRKDEVADQFSAVSTLEIVNLRNVMAEVLTGPRSYRTKAIIKRHMRPLLESSVVRTAIQLTMGAEGYASLKSRVAERAVTMSLGSVSDPRFSRERSGIIREIFRKRMMEMSNAEFQELLRPAFKEDEWVLILLGAVLGGIAGGVQLLAMLSF